MRRQVRISGWHYEQLTRHLFPSDGSEAVAVALCGRSITDGCETLLVHDLTLIPYSDCSIQEGYMVKWSTQSIHNYFDLLGRKNVSLLKIHSHPGGYGEFSETDDESDHEFFSSAFGWSRDNLPHASAVMLPNGEIFGRFFYSDLCHEKINSFQIAGDTIKKFEALKIHNDEFSLRTIQTFGEKTYSLLKNFKIGVVGCSGTGSPTIEQLVRLGVGKLVLVDPDFMEEKNLNRIINSTVKDTFDKKLKVDVFSDVINKIGLGTDVKTYSTNLYDDLTALKELTECDVIFGCMDSVDGRFLLNQLCAFYLIPYFDMGVHLSADGKGGIENICGSVHYIQPLKSSLLTRRLITEEGVRATSQKRKDEAEYAHLVKNSYIINITVNNPAVISVNMQISSHAINEFLNRIHPFRSDFAAISTIDYTNNYIINEKEEDLVVDAYLVKKAGRGDTLPFIEMSELK